MTSRRYRRTSTQHRHHQKRPRAIHKVPLTPSILEQLPLKGAGAKLQMLSASTISRASFFDYRVLPERTQIILSLLNADSARSADDILTTYASDDSDAKRQITDTLRVLNDTGLVQRHVLQRAALFQLTQLGQRLISEQAIRPALYADIIHYLFFSHCDAPDAKGVVSGWSWVYQMTCRLLWHARPVVPKPTQLATNLNQRVIEIYTDHIGGVHPNAPGGVLSWIRTLEPPFIDVNRKPGQSAGRSWCSPELFMLGIARLYRLLSVPFGTPLLLDAQSLEQISILCLADLPCLEDVLDLCVATFSFFTTHSGEWGRSVILTRDVTIPDVL